MLLDDFSVNVAVLNDVTVTHSFYLKLNFLQNVYYKFLIFGKLREWRCFVTYLSNDPRMLWRSWLTYLLRYEYDIQWVERSNTDKTQ